MLTYLFASLTKAIRTILELSMKNDCLSMEEVCLIVLSVGSTLIQYNIKINRNMRRTEVIEEQEKEKETCSLCS